MMLPRLADGEAQAAQGAAATERRQRREAEAAAAELQQPPPAAAGELWREEPSSTKLELLEPEVEGLKVVEAAGGEPAKNAGFDGSCIEPELRLKLMRDAGVSGCRGSRSSGCPGR